MNNMQNKNYEYFIDNYGDRNYYVFAQNNQGKHTNLRTAYVCQY